jgi:proteasome lid subunit RPN8/RPN11
MGMNNDLESVEAAPSEEYSGGVDLENLPRRSLGALSGPRSGDFQVVIRQEALDRIHAHGNKTPNIEICGVLVGDVFRDNTGSFLHVETVVEGTASHGSAGQVTFTQETWQHIQSQMDEQYPDQRIVGWYHTHPGHGIFLSEMDLFIHQSFFNLPWQTAFVYDPQRHEEGIFGWRDNAVQKFEYLIESKPAAVPETKPVVETAQVNETPGEKKIRFREGMKKRVLLSIMGLLLFALMGYLLGMFILELKEQWPHLFTMRYYLSK